MRIVDITLPVQASLACWPGDTPYAFCTTMRKRDGDSVNLGSVTMSVHTGTHADAPFHFLESGATMEQVALDPYIGAAVVIDVSGKARICVEDVQAVDLSQTPRVLFRTNAWKDHAQFPETIPVMEAAVPAYLHSQGVILVGLDVPSVDPIDSKELPIHHQLAERGICILESLALADVAEGTYELIALPLKLVGADGAPVRAILRQ